MILAAFDFVWMPLLKLLEASIWLLNKIIAFIASFENFILKDISLNSLMMWSCYFFIFSSIIWIKKPTYKKLTTALFTIILFQLFAIEAKYSSQKNNEWIVFNKKNSTIITEKHGNKVTLHSNKNELQTANDNLSLKSYLVANFCKITKKKLLANTYFFNHKKIAIIDSSNTYLEDEKPDILLLCNSPKINLERLFQKWKPNQVVVDASNFKSYINVWKATCRKEKIPFHDTAEKGFFRL
jgi:competence protein ComEC